MLVSDVSDDEYLGQPTPEPAAVSAIIIDPLGQPYPKITVVAAIAETDTEISRGETDADGRIKFVIPSADAKIKIIPKPGLLYKAIPESVTVTSLPTTGIIPIIGKWGWGDSANFTVYSKKLEDFVTTNTMIAAGVIAFIAWFFLRNKSGDE
jgi:hypothetical protein